MTTIGNISIAYAPGYNPAKIEQIREKVRKDPNLDLMLSKHPHRYSSGMSASTGINDEGFSELIKLYGYPESERIYRDPACKGPLESVIFSVVRKSFVITPPEELSSNRKARQLALFMNTVHRKMKGSWRQACNEIASPMIFYGKGLLEKSFKHLPSNHPKFPGMRIYDELRGKFNGIWDVKEDAFNRVYAIESKLSNELFPVDKFVLGIWNRRFGRNQGTGIYDSIYKFLNAKHLIYQHMLIYVDKFASPIPFVEVDNYRDEALMAFCAQIAKNLYAGCEVVLPKGVKAGFLESARNGQDPFLVLFNWIDSQVNMAIRGTSGLSINNGTGSGTGSHASDKVKKDTESIYEWLLQITLEELWFEQVCMPLIKHNFPEETYPEELYPIGYFLEPEQQSRSDDREDLKTARDLDFFNPDMNVDDEIEARKRLRIRSLTEKEVNEKRKRQAEQNVISVASKVNDDDGSDDENEDQDENSEE